MMILTYSSLVVSAFLEMLAVSGILSVVMCHETTYVGDAHVAEGKSFQITCLLSRLYIEKWTKDGIDISQQDEDYKRNAEDMKNGSILLTLKVGMAKPTHSGEYRCNSFSERSHRIDIVSPNFEKTGDFQEVILSKNEPIRLICDVDESDTFPVSWYHEGHRVLSENDPRVRIEGKSLIIFPSQEKDSGNYTCDTVSKFSRPIEGRGSVIHVKSSAKIQPLPRQLRVQVGQDLKVECKVQGYPLPWITWYIDNITAIEEFQDSRIEILRNSDGYPNAVLLWRNITFEDKRIVTCQAKNSVNVVESAGLIVIRPNSIITNEEPQGSGITLERKKSLTLQCNVSTPTSAALMWYKDGVIINDTNDRISISQSENKLIIKHAELEDAGTYMCVADQFNNATIQVYAHTDVEKFPKSLNLVQGDTLRLQCKATGFPIPKVTWYKGSEIINASEERVKLKPNDKNLTDGMLVITDVDYEDRAVYTCIADNGMTSANSTIMVRIKDKLAALWPFLGICAEVAILCAIIFIYEKKRVKPDFDESDTDQIPESKNVADKDKVPDVRQRK